MSVLLVGKSSLFHRVCALSMVMIFFILEWKQLLRMEWNGMEWKQLLSLTKKIVLEFIEFTILTSRIQISNIFFRS